MMIDRGEEVPCPMPDCSELLYVTYITAQSLTPADLDGSSNQPVGEIGDVETATWRVECAAEHVILLPTEHFGCPDEEQEGVICPHGYGEHDTDDWKVFRPPDKARLRDLIERLN